MERSAWAIKMKRSPFPEDHKYEPRFYGVFAIDRFADLEPWHDGIRTALFRTRGQARRALKDMAVDGASVVRVSISITEEN